MPDRRRFLTHCALLGGSAAAAAYGYRYLNRLPPLTVNLAGLPAGHRLRDRAWQHDKPVSHHRCQTLILGSGAAALSAAWYLHRNGRRDFLLLEGPERNGNNAAYRYGELTAPSGAHYLALPSKESRHVRDMLSDLNIIQGEDRDGELIFRDTDLVHAPAERLWYQNRWQEGLLPENDADSRRFFQLIQQLKFAYRHGRKLFAIPLADSADSRWRQLDGLTFARWLARNGFRSPRLLWYLDYCCRDDYGAGIAQVSAFAGLHYFAARGNRRDSVLTWPDGLNYLSEGLRRHINLHPLKQLPPQHEWHFRQPACFDASAVRIREHNDFVEVWLRDRQGRTIRADARHVICAAPLPVAARITDHAPRYGFHSALPQHAPWLVGNFVLHRFPPEQGKQQLAWDNVVYGSNSLGYVVSTHQLIRAAKPEYTVFTAYTALNHAAPADIRRQLLHAAHETLLQQAAQDLLSVYGKRFWSYVHHADITVRAHAMSIPAPGSLNHPVLSALRRHRSRLLFAHSDLSGYSVFEEAAYWGVQAARAVLDGD